MIKDCDTCKYEIVSGREEPCKTCGTGDNWEPKKGCHNCYHAAQTDKSACNSCSREERNDNWKPKEPVVLDGWDLTRTLIADKRIIHNDLLAEEKLAIRAYGNRCGKNGQLKRDLDYKPLVEAAKELLRNYNVCSTHTAKLKETLENIPPLED